MSVLERAQGAFTPPDLVQRAAALYRREGVTSLARAAAQFLRYWGTVGVVSARYKLEYGELAPEVGDRVFVDPAEIEWVMAKNMPDDAPPFGIVGGDWDRTKLHRFEYGEMWSGLLDRYAEGKPWTETSYYRTGMRRIEEGVPLRVMDSDDQTPETFEAHLRYVDELYESIDTNGFDEGGAVTVNIGRDGALILYADGNHRTTLAQAAGVTSIPVNIRYRHANWQAIRRDVRQASSYGALSERARDHVDHPDTRDLVTFPEPTAAPEA